MYHLLNRLKRQTSTVRIMVWLNVNSSNLIDTINKNEWIFLLQYHIEEEP